MLSWIFLPNQPTYTIPHYDVTVPLVVWAFVGGAPPSDSAPSVSSQPSFAHKLRPHGWRLLLTPVLVLTALGCAAIAFLLGNGKDVVELSFNGDIGLMLLLVLPALELLATASCLGSGGTAPGAVFTPVMTYGALLGGPAGALWSYVFPARPWGATP